jgi:(p)ppGpp synthase/HD superfamily hydrolase
MQLNKQQELLLEFVKEKHGSQMRKYTNTPYWEHLVRVAELSYKYLPFHNTIEIALCHDLYEDTSCSWVELHKFLLDIGYSHENACTISDGVTELSDHFTPKLYPLTNRKERKLREAERLGKTTFTSQSIKYADLIDNTESIVKFDPGFAKIYLKEKREILQHIRNGQIDLLILCCYTLYEANKRLYA